MKARLLRWRAELALCCIVGMEVTWFTPWAVLLSGSGSDPIHRVPWFVWLGLLLLAICLARGLTALKAPMTLLLAIGASAGLIVLYGYAGYPADRSVRLATWLDNLLSLGGGPWGLWGMALPLLASYCAVRGALLAGRRVTARYVRECLVGGAVAWLLYAIAAMLFDQPPASPGWAFAFVALAAVGSGMARLEEARQARIASRAAAAGYWPAMVVACAGVLTGAGVLVASALSLFAAGAWSRAIAGLRSLDRQVAEGISWLLATLFPWNVVPPEGTPPPTPYLTADPPPGEESAVVIPVWVWVVMGAILVGLVVRKIVVDWIRRRRASLPPSLEPSEWDSVPMDYQRGLRGRLKRLARRRGPRPEVQLATVREIYGSVLRFAAWWGVAREEKETPYEFQRRLDTAQPEVQAPLGTITEAYVRARYGGVALTDAEVERLRAEWEKVRTSMEV